MRGTQHLVALGVLLAVFLAAQPSAAAGIATHAAVPPSDRDAWYLADRVTEQALVWAVRVQAREPGRDRERSQPRIARSGFDPEVERWRPLAVRVTHLLGAELGYALDPDLLLALISTESRGDPRATSHASAGGLMQVGASAFADMVKLHPSLFTRADRYDPEENMLGGALYLLFCARYIDVDLRTPAGLLATLHAYNLGPEALRSALEKLAGWEMDPRSVAHTLPLETRLHAERTLRAYGD